MPGTDSACHSDRQTGIKVDDDRCWPYKYVADKEKEFRTVYHVKRTPVKRVGTVVSNVCDDIIKFEEKMARHSKSWVDFNSDFGSLDEDTNGEG